MNLISKKITPPKLVCDIPQKISIELENYRVTKTRYKTLSSMIQAFFPLYLNEHSNLSISKIALYQSWDSGKNNFSYYLTQTKYNQLEQLAKAHIRSDKAQAIHFIYFIYTYISNN